MPYINVNDAYILDNTGKQVDDAVDYALANSNRNLLDNAFFKINQRGATVVTTNNEYVADRWLKGGTGGSVTNNGNGSITPAGGAGFRQYNSLGKIINGKTYTLSVRVRGGTVYSRTGVFNSGTSDWQIAGQLTPTSWQLWAGVRNNSGFLDLMVSGDGTLSVDAVKLELGPYSTLANDLPPTYEYELDKCRWYFERIRTFGGYGFFGNGVVSSATSANIIVPMHEKRAATITVSKSGTLRLYNGTNNYSVSNLALAGSPVSNALHLVVTASGMTVGTAVMLTAQNDANAYIDVSADIMP